MNPASPTDVLAAEDTLWGPDQDIYTTKVMNSILSSESNASLIVLNGDLISGENTQPENSTAYMHQILKPMLDRNLPFATTYGNHDSDFNLSRWDLLVEEKRLGCSLSLTGCEVGGEGVGTSNYWLPILGPKEVDDKTPKVILWFLDSRGGWEYQERGEDGQRIGIDGWVDQRVSLTH